MRPLSFSLGSTGVTYWEGSVSLEGVKDKLRVNGEGYVELTGYAGAFDAPPPLSYHIVPFFS